GLDSTGELALLICAGEPLVQIEIDAGYRTNLEETRIDVARRDGVSELRELPCERPFSRGNFQKSSPLWEPGKNLQNLPMRPFVCDDLKLFVCLCLVQTRHWIGH